MATRFSAEQLSRFVISVYESVGLREQDARLLADTLVQADLWGHQSHGVMRTFWYANRFRSGATRIDTSPEVVTDAGAICVLDGCNGIGQVVAHEAMNQAAQRAKVHGIGAVAVRNSGHFGTAMYFTRKAAQKGCIGILTTNASPAMAPWGGREKLIGTNPWSVSAPAGKHPVMMLDIANSAVARGKLYLAKKQNRPVPPGWAIDADGRPTTDPAEGILGNILPMAGHKGYAIATMIDVLSGILSGSSFSGEVVGPYMSAGESGAGHLALALDIESFRPLSEFERDMEMLIARIKGTPLAEGVEEIFYPGELEERAQQRHLEAGVTLPPDTLAELNLAAGELGLEGLV